MAVIKIKKGLNIPIKGVATKVMMKADASSTYAVKPIDFHGVLPRMLVKENELVKAGTPLFTDKFKPYLIFSSPVSGVVKSILRGEKRAIQEVVIESDAKQEYKMFGASPTENNKENIIKKLIDSGCWPYLKQRPYDIIANPSDTPKAIFISAYDTAPLAPDNDFILYDEEAEFQAGINILTKLTSGKVHLNISNRTPQSHIFNKIKNVSLNVIIGKHPAGNVGVQIHHIDPINKGEVVWVIQPHDVLIIGRLFSKGVYDTSRFVALTGSEVSKPAYYKVLSGVNISSLLQKNKSNANEVRVISGDVLTGTNVGVNGHLGFYDNQITIIPEGKYHEFLGWAMPGAEKYSATRTFLSKLIPNKQFRIDTNYHGGERAYVFTGSYEKVLPMDIFPLHLIKAILAENVDMMEKLGIYEVAPEDFALCEFIDPSKTEIQEIIRKGLDLMNREMS